MKRIVSLVAVVVLMGSFALNAGIDDIIAALKTGNSSQIARYFDNTVEITLPDKGNSYSRNQGEVVLRDFFTLHPVKGFEVLHKGENGGSQYCIGTLTTRNGNFRTTVYMKQKGEKQTLQEIGLKHVDQLSI
jgi:hypothetical protein